MTTEQDKDNTRTLYRQHGNEIKATREGVKDNMRINLETKRERVKTSG